MALFSNKLRFLANSRIYTLNKQNFSTKVTAYVVSGCIADARITHRQAMNLHCTMVREVCNGAASLIVSVSAETTNNNVVYCRLDIGSGEHYVKRRRMEPYATTSENTHFSRKI